MAILRVADTLNHAKGGKSMKKTLSLNRVSVCPVPKTLKGQMAF